MNSIMQWKPILEKWKQRAAFSTKVSVFTLMLENVRCLTWVNNLGDQPFNANDTFFEKLTSLTPWYAQVRRRIWRVGILGTYWMDDNTLCNGWYPLQYFTEKQTFVLLHKKLENEINK